MQVWLPLKGSLKVGLLISSTLMWDPPSPPPAPPKPVDPLVEAFTQIGTEDEAVIHYDCSFSVKDPDGYSTCLSYWGSTFPKNISSYQIEQAEASVKTGECVLAIKDRQDKSVCVYLKD